MTVKQNSPQDHRLAGCLRQKYSEKSSTSGLHLLEINSGFLSD